MTHAFVDASAPATDAEAGAATRRWRLAAGWGGIAAFGFWLLQPFLVLIVLGGDEGGSTYDRNAAHPFLGTYEAVTFAGIAVGLIVMAAAVHALSAVGGQAATLPARVGAVLGTVAGVSWLVVAGISLAPFTSVGFFVAEAVPGAAEQAAVYETLSLMITALGLTYALAMVGWLGVLATAGRRAGIVGLPMSIVAVVAAAGALLPLVMPFAPPWGMIGPLAFALVFGIVCLVRARRAGRAGRVRRVSDRP